MLYIFYDATKDRQTALSYLQEGIKHCPQSSMLHEDLESLYRKLGELQKSIEEYKIAFKLGVDAKAGTYYNMGNTYNDLKDYPNAILCYRNAISEDTMKLDARRALVGVYYKNGDFKQAREQANIIIRLDPDGKYGTWAREALKHIVSD